MDPWKVAVSEINAIPRKNVFVQGPRNFVQLGFPECILPAAGGNVACLPFQMSNFKIEFSFGHILMLHLF